MLFFRYLHLFLEGVIINLNGTEVLLHYELSGDHTGFSGPFFMKRNTHPPNVVTHRFFFRQTNQEKITFCLRPASVSATLS